MNQIEEFTHHNATLVKQADAFTEGFIIGFVFALLVVSLTVALL